MHNVRLASCNECRIVVIQTAKYKRMHVPENGIGNAKSLHFPVHSSNITSGTNKCSLRQKLVKNAINDSS